MADRKAVVERNTRETEIKLELNLDGSGQYKVHTGVGFFDHMLEGFARHGLFDLNVTCKGDLNVDTHHSIEDVGIVLGEAIKKALGNKKGIKRYGSFLLPMDDALISCAIDLSGRAFYASDIDFAVPKLGDMDTEMVQEFFAALASGTGMNLHFLQLRGTNNHHIAEACFKAFAKALDIATSFEPRMDEVWSTKGTL